MIEFIPAYDDATLANLKMIAPLLQPGAIIGAEAGATLRDALVSAPDRPLFAMSHGRPDALLGQGGAPALTIREAGLLRGRVGYAFACHTGTELGGGVASAGGWWFGYAGVIDAPGDGAEEAALLRALFSRVRDLCWQAADSGSPARIIDLIWDMIGDTESAMLEIDSSNITFFCLFSMRNRLRLWCPGAASPLKHPEATDPPLY